MEKKKRYYKAVQPIKGGTIYKKLCYGYVREINGVKYFADYYYTNYRYTEATTGYSVLGIDAQTRADDIKRLTLNIPNVETYPLITAKALKELQRTAKEGRL